MEESQVKILFKAWNARQPPALWAAQMRVVFARETGLASNANETSAMDTASEDTVDYEQLSKLLAKVFLSHVVVSESTSPLLVAYLRHALDGLLLHPAHLFSLACEHITPEAPERYQSLLRLLSDYGLAICGPTSRISGLIKPQDMTLALLRALTCLVRGVAHVSNHPLATTNAQMSEVLICHLIKVDRIVLCLALARKYHPELHQSVLNSLSKVPHSDIMGSGSFTTNGFMNSQGFTHRHQSLSSLLPRVLVPVPEFIRAETMAAIGFESILPTLGRISAHILIYELVTGSRVLSPYAIRGSIQALLELGSLGSRLVFEQLWSATARMSAQEASGNAALSLAVSVLPNALVDAAKGCRDPAAAQEDLEASIVSFARASVDVVDSRHMMALLDLAIKQSAISLKTVEIQLRSLYLSVDTDPMNPPAPSIALSSFLSVTRLEQAADVEYLVTALQTPEAVDAHFVHAVKLIKDSDLIERPVLHTPAVELIAVLLQNETRLDMSSLRSLVHGLTRDWPALLNLRGSIPRLVRIALARILELGKAPYSQGDDDASRFGLMLSFVVATNTRFDIRMGTASSAAIGCTKHHGETTKGEDSHVVLSPELTECWSDLQSLLHCIRPSTEGDPRRVSTTPEVRAAASQIWSAITNGGPPPLSSTRWQIIHTAPAMCNFFSTTAASTKTIETAFHSLSKYAPGLCVVLAANFAQELANWGLISRTRRSELWPTYCALAQDPEILPEVQDVILGEVQLSERYSAVWSMWTEAPDAEGVTSKLSTILLGTCEYSGSVLTHSSLAARILGPVDYAVGMVRHILASQQRTHCVASEAVSHVHALEFTAATAAPWMSCTALSGMITDKFPELLDMLRANHAPPTCFVSLAIFVVQLLGLCHGLCAGHNSGTVRPVQQLLELVYDTLRDSRYTNPSPASNFGIAVLALIAPTSLPSDPNIPTVLRSTTSRLCARLQHYTAAFSLLDSASSDECAEAWTSLLHLEGVNGGGQGRME